MAALTFKVGGDTSGLKKALGGARSMLSGLASSIKTLGIGAALGGAAAAASGLALAIKGIRASADMEQLEVSFSVLTGSARQARESIAELMEFSNRTPLDPGEVVDSGRSLLAFGVEADNLVETLEMVGNVAQGIGAPLGEIAEIYGKARVQGRLFGEDINQLTGRGIPVIGELAKVLGVTNEEVKGMVTAGAVGFPELEKAFRAMSGEGGQFANMMERQSGTFSGMMSTLAGKVNSVIRESFTEVTAQLKPVLGQLMAVIDSMKPKIVEAGQTLATMIGVIMELFRQGQLEALITDSLIVAGNEFTNVIIKGFALAGQVLLGAMKGVAAMMMELFKKLMDPEFLKGLAKTAGAGVLKTFDSFAGSGVLGPVANVLDRVMPDSLRERGRVTADEMLEEGIGQIAVLGRRQEEALLASIANTKAQMDEIMDSDGLIDSSDEIKRIKALVGDALNAMELLRDQAKDEKEKEPAGIEKPEILMDGFGEGRRNPIVSSLGRIGGAALRGPRADQMDRERNRYLRQIVQNTGSPQTAVFG